MTTKKINITIIILSLILILTGCSENENLSGIDGGIADSIEGISENLIDNQGDGWISNQEKLNYDVNNYEGVWQRTGVASYQAAEIRISNWKEESFDVVLFTGYSNTSGGSLQGTATFLDDDIAVLYDKEVEALIQDFWGDEPKDVGIYFQFTGDSIIVTHDPLVRNVFGGGGFATAEGTYIQGEPEYTTCTDIAELFSESEMEALQNLLGDRYETLLRHVVEIGEVEEVCIDGGRLWKAYWMPYHQIWCNIIIYDNGDIFVEGYSDDGKGYEYYTNTKDAEMPDISAVGSVY